MRRNIIYLPLLVIAMIAIVSCHEPDTSAPVNPNKVTAIELTPREASLTVGERLTLQVHLTPATAQGSVTFESSAPAIASISAEGVVTALAEGTAEITARVNGLSSQCAIKVFPKEQPKPQGPFEITLTQITATNIFAKIKPSDPNMRYSVNANTLEAYERIIATHSSIPQANRAWWEAVSGETSGGVEYRKAVARETFQGEQTIDLGEISGGAYPFPDDHTIVIVVYGMDQDGVEQTDVIKMEEKTKPATLSNLTFEVKIQNVQSNYIDATITPSDNAKEHYYSLQSARFVDFYLKPKPGKEIIDGVPAKKAMCLRLLQSTFSNDEEQLAIHKGSFTISEETNSGLNASTQYYIIVFGWDKEAGITTDVSLTPFETIASE